MEESKRSREEALWTKGYILILISNFLIFLVNNALSTGIPMYTQQNHYGGTMVGLTTTVFYLAALFSRPLFGALIDSRGRRVVMLIGSIIMVVSNLLYRMVDSVTFLLILRALNGIGFSALGTVATTMVADHVPESRLAEGISFAGTSSIFASAIGPSISIHFIENEGFGVFFVMTFVVSSLILLFTFVLPHKAEETIVTDSKKSIADSLFERSALPSVVIGFIISLGMSSVPSFIPLYGAERSIERIGSFYTVYAAVSLMVRLLSGKIMKKYGNAKIFIMGTISMGVCFIILTFAYDLSLVWVAAAMFGIGGGLAMPILSVTVMQRCQENRRGAANATLMAAFDVGMGVGSLIWGAVSEHLSYTWVYMLCMVTMIGTVIIYHMLLQREKAESGQN